MKKTDKILLGIVIGIVLLVVFSFVLALNKPQPSYMPDDSPEGAAFNYLFAMQQKNYERAYGYLSPSIKGYPRTVDVFVDDVDTFSYTFRRLYDTSTTLNVESTTITGETAHVGIQETRFYEGDLFSSGQYSYFFNMTLHMDTNGQWKIVDSDRYWLNCWNRSGRCK